MKPVRTIAVSVRWRRLVLQISPAVSDPPFRGPPQDGGRLIVEGVHLMMIERPAVLTPEELAALLEIALEIDLGAASRKIPAITLARLVALRCVEMTPGGPIVTGDGLMRLTESQPDGPEAPA
jgi:hypothetical protein